MTVAVVAAVAAYVVLRPSDDQPEPKARPTATRTNPTAWPSTATPKVVKPIGEPTQLVIRGIGVDAKVLPVGTTAKGAQEVPASLHDTGWWKDGQQPGQPGNAVIVGHTASKADGVFDELSDLGKGDRLTVKGRDGTLTYRITSEKEIKVADFAAESDQIYRETGASGLVLMTCGDWNGSRFETTVIAYAEAVGRS
ncbi:class F sortase [Aeromicrobium sp. 9AM]|uniref:class F sortase n=1 Tax=Aeromicrobium sp. 9AM TaxID=2653126 RepID=UPI00135B2AAC|nr:class F sortase [Aeromicrobium sp. 9AM]